MFTNPVTEKLAAFVRGIGIDIRAAELDQPTFLPGIEIRSGAILVNESGLTYPGDILHEAGHIAVTGPCCAAPARQCGPWRGDGGDCLVLCGSAHARN